MHLILVVLIPLAIPPFRYQKCHPPNASHFLLLAFDSCPATLTISVCHTCKASYKLGQAPAGQHLLGACHVMLGGQQGGATHPAWPLSCLWDGSGAWRKLCQMTLSLESLIAYLLTFQLGNLSAH